MRDTSTKKHVAAVPRNFLRDWFIPEYIHHENGKEIYVYESTTYTYYIRDDVCTLRRRDNDNYVDASIPSFDKFSMMLPSILAEPSLMTSLEYN